MHLPRAFYRVELADTGIAVWMYGQQDKPEPTNRHAWDNFTVPTAQTTLCTSTWKKKKPTY